MAVLVKNQIRHLTLCLALFRCGIPSISFEYGHSGVGGVTLSAVLGDETARQSVDSRNRLIDVTDDWFGTDLGPGELPVGYSDSQQICRMCLTSGTTGQPKIIELTVGDVGRLAVGFAPFNWSVILCLPGLSSSFGFSTACTALAAGRTVCFSESPFQSIRMIELYSIDFVMAATEQLLALTRVARTSGAHLRSLRIVEIAGSVPTRALLETAMIYVCKDIFCRYGASETGLMARASAREVLSRPGFAGHVLPGVEVKVIGRDGKTYKPGEVGLIRSRRDPRWHDAGKAGDEAWVDLGDVGLINSDGELYVVGRATDMAELNLQDLAGGQISSIHEVEHLLRLEWDATDAAAVFAGEATAAAQSEIWIGTVDCKDVNADKFEEILRARGINTPVRFFPLKSIPRSANGKVQRAELRSMILAAASERREF